MGYAMADTRWDFRLLDCKHNRLRQATRGFGIRNFPPDRPPGGPGGQLVEFFCGFLQIGQIALEIP